MKMTMKELRIIASLLEFGLKDCEDFGFDLKSVNVEGLTLEQVQKKIDLGTVTHCDIPFYFIDEMPVCSHFVNTDTQYGYYIFPNRCFFQFSFK